MCSSLFSRGNQACARKANAKRRPTTQSWDAAIYIENVLGEHRSTTPLALELSKVLLYSVQFFFWFPVLFLITYLHRHMGSPKERSFISKERA